VTAAAPGLEISSAWITGAAAAAAAAAEAEAAAVGEEAAAAATVAAPISSLPGGRRYRVPRIPSPHFLRVFSLSLSLSLSGDL
jgi:hypothetical protein